MPDPLVRMVATAVNNKENPCPRGDDIPMERDQNEQMSTVEGQMVINVMET